MRLVTTLAAALAVALACAAAATAGPRMYLGFLDDLSLRYDPARARSFDAVEHAHASIVRTVVRWYQVAPTRPADPADPLDPAYRWDDLDEFVANAQERRLEVLMTVWGTPPWANGGAAPNVPPTDAADPTAFAHALAARYSGSYAAYPFVRFFSIWNEPNTRRFLDAPDPPSAYARLAEAAYAGLKSGSPRALVAVGETAASHAPAAFMQAVARADPHLPFDAWAHHPYPLHAGDAPQQPEPWPDVGLRELASFGRALDAAFGRADVPIWVTEYAESGTRVPRARQARDLADAVRLASAVDRVEMFVWLMLRDHPGEPWQSGVLGTPAYHAFSAAAGALDPRNELLQVSTRTLLHRVRVPALEMKYGLETSETVGVVYTLSGCGRAIERDAASRIAADGWVPPTLAFRPAPGAHYYLDVKLEDVHGFSVERSLELIGAGPAVRGVACPRAT